MSDWRSGDEAGSYSGPPPTGPHPGGQHPYPYPPPIWPPPTWPGYPPPANPYAPVPQGDPRPGTLLAAAVLGYVTAALLVLAGMLLGFSVSLLDDMLDTNSFTVEFTLACVANFVAAGLLIGGSVAMTAGNPTGRLVYLGGAALVVALTIYWLARWAATTGREVLVVYGLFFAALAVVGMALSFAGNANNWLARR